MQNCHKEKNIDLKVAQEHQDNQKKGKKGCESTEE